MQKIAKESLTLIDIENAKKLSKEREKNIENGKLNIVFADELPNEFVPPDELLEGILTAGDGSILYGDSNSGKTFFAIDIACAIAGGINWMGRRTEPGLVIYLAAESPSSVKRRLQAYQKYHQIRIPNFAVIQNPIDLFSNETDTNAVIQITRVLEQQTGQKARLIVGDTLARLSAGANENAGQDMGVVIQHFDRIRTETFAHFMLIHHKGKNAAAGARGWSGVRAAIDTEIEITDSIEGRCAEITKQRDLDSKGLRIGFRLDPVALGLTKWKSTASSCVVVSTDAPVKIFSKKTGQMSVDVYKFLLSDSNGFKAKNIADNFLGQYADTSVYRTVRELISNGQAIKFNGKIFAKT